MVNDKLTLPHPKRLGYGKTNDPQYCPYHQMISHPLNQCFIVSKKINEMWKNGLITFNKNYRSTSVNIVSCGQTFESPKKVTTSFKVIRRVQASRELVPYLTSDGQPMWVHLDLLKDEDWKIVKTKPMSKQHRQAKKHLYRLKQQEKAKNKQEIPEESETSSTVSLGQQKSSSPNLQNLWGSSPLVTLCHHNSETRLGRGHILL